MKILAAGKHVRTQGDDGDVSFRINFSLSDGKTTLLIVEDDIKGKGILKGAGTINVSDGYTSLSLCTITSNYFTGILLNYNETSDCACEMQYIIFEIDE